MNSNLPDDADGAKQNAVTAPELSGGSAFTPAAKGSTSEDEQELLAVIARLQEKNPARWGKLEDVKNIIHGESDANKSLKERTSPEFASFLSPSLLHGNDLKVLQKCLRLAPAELVSVLGVNSTGLYNKAKNGEKELTASLSILVRICGVYTECIPLHRPPELAELSAKIRTIDPTFKAPHLGPLLGCEQSQYFRLQKEGLDKASQTVRNLIYMIDRIITADPSNWFSIKHLVEVEAESRLVQPPESVWKKGGWKRHLAKTRADSTQKKRPLPKDSGVTSRSPTAKPLLRKKLAE